MSTEAVLWAKRGPVIQRRARVWDASQNQWINPVDELGRPVMERVPATGKVGLVRVAADIETLKPQRERRFISYLHADGNVCNGAETCDSAGQCVASLPPPDGTVCAPGNACVGDSLCLAGSCQPGSSLPIDDNNPCTADIRDYLQGCIDHFEGDVPEGSLLAITIEFVADSQWRKGDYERGLANGLLLALQATMSDVMPVAELLVLSPEPEEEVEIRPIRGTS
jgi:hypothetical protein